MRNWACHWIQTPPFRLVRGLLFALWLLPPVFLLWYFFAETDGD